MTFRTIWTLLNFLIGQLCIFWGFAQQIFDNFGTIEDILTVRETLHPPKSTQDTSIDIENPNRGNHDILETPGRAFVFN